MNGSVIRGEVIFVIYKKTVTTLLILPHSYKLVIKISNSRTQTRFLKFPLIFSNKCTLNGFNDMNPFQNLKSSNRKQPQRIKYPRWSIVFFIDAFLFDIFIKNDCTKLTKKIGNFRSLVYCCFTRLWINHKTRARMSRLATTVARPWKCLDRSEFYLFPLSHYHGCKSLVRLPVYCCLFFFRRKPAYRGAW